MQEILQKFWKKDKGTEIYQMSKIKQVKTQKKMKIMKAFQRVYNDVVLFSIPKVFRTDTKIVRVRLQFKEIETLEILLILEITQAMISVLKEEI